jgi:hypothetical protein
MCFDLFNHCGRLDVARCGYSSAAELTGQYAFSGMGACLYSGGLFTPNLKSEGDRE